MSSLVDKTVYDSSKDKSVFFFSASNKKDWEVLFNFGVYEILVSYFYLRKDKNFTSWLAKLNEKNGVFMTDSGGFSFIAGEAKDDYYKEEFWLPYLNDYVQWLTDNQGLIYCAANLDLDIYLGREVIDKWNEKYFKPLEKSMNIVYVAHKDWDGYYADKNGLKRVKEYMKAHDYVGVNRTFKNSAVSIYELAKLYQRRVHGFAWTSISMLMKNPLFSVDSTTWLSGAKFGTTYTNDGRNFRTLDKDKKSVRKHSKLKCALNGVDRKLLLKEDRVAVHEYNLLAWIQARNNYIKLANTKLWNKPVMNYAKAGI